MTLSTTAGKSKPKNAIRPWAVLFWLLIWQAASMGLGQEILLVSPVSVIRRLADLITETDFWAAVAFSCSHILCGFLLGTFTGIFCAVLSARFPWFQALLAPLTVAIRSTPVASFIILALIWIPSRNLSIFITFLMVMPILYSNTLQGILCTDLQLLEMASLFGISPVRRFRYIYLSHLLPFLRSAFSVSLGLCWKSGIAAEVIGIPKGSIGERLYEAKIYLDTPDLFAWTAVIILISILFERLFLSLMHIAAKQIEGR